MEPDAVTVTVHLTSGKVGKVELLLSPISDLADRVWDRLPRSETGSLRSGFRCPSCRFPLCFGTPQVLRYAVGYPFHQETQAAR
jgi:hypothetical protein